jgi:alginate production protein
MRSAGDNSRAIPPSRCNRPDKSVATGPRQLLIGLLLFATTAITGPSAADESGSREPLFKLKGTIAFESKVERNFDLDTASPDYVFELEPFLRLGFDIAPKRQLSGFVEVEALTEFQWEHDKPREVDQSLRVNQAFLRASDLMGGAEIKLGRWLYRDRREWLIKENLDGVHVHLERAAVTIDVLAGRVNVMRRDIFDANSKGDAVNNYALMAEVEAVQNVHFGAFAVLRDEREGGRDRPLFLGLRSHGEPISGLTYWADVANVRGRADGRRLNGYGFDVGATYSLTERPFQPRFTLGYAWGSGDRNAHGSVDRAFRQTGLESNKARLGGFAKFKYYGEVLNPELSNLAIATAGVGLTADERISIDLFYHHYRRAQPGQGLRDHSLSIQPEVAGGSGRHLGDGLDLIVGYRPEGAITIDSSVGWFRPGAAFANRDSALFARFELKSAF